MIITNLMMQNKVGTWIVKGWGRGAMSQGFKKRMRKVGDKRLRFSKDQRVKENGMEVA